jgi:NitT/TauT family transport system substrate-binding protein
LKKRIIILTILIVIISIVTILVLNHKKEVNTTKITLAEVTHSVFYTPMYVAMENGYFKEEGIEIELLLTPGADKVSAAVLSGDANVGFAGAESAIYIYNSDNEDYLQIFSGLTKRDGQFIIGKTKHDFDWNELKGKEILVGRSSGMPALNFLNALKNAGINQDEIKINTSVDFASLSGSFISGTGDYVNLFEPNATIMEKEGFGHVLESVGKLSGEFPYTVFYAKKSYLKDNEDTLKRFTTAIAKGLKYVEEHDSKTIAKAIKPQFKTTDEDQLAIMIERYKNADCWLKTPFITDKLYQNLHNFLKDNKLIKKNTPYKELVKNLYN